MQTGECASDGSSGGMITQSWQFDLAILQEEERRLKIVERLLIPSSGSASESGKINRQIFASRCKRLPIPFPISFLGRESNLYATIWTSHTSLRNFRWHDASCLL